MPHAPPPDRPRTDGAASATPAPSAFGASGEPGAVESRLEQLRADLRARLRPACRHWPDGEFEALVQRMARMKLRWSEMEYPG